MGQMGQAFSNPNTFGAQPSGFNGSEWAARFLGNGLQGALGGLGQKQQPQRMGAQTNAMQYAPQQQAPQFSAQNLPGGGAATGPVGNNGSMWPGDSQTQAKGRQNPYFYGYGQ